MVARTSMSSATTSCDEVHVDNDGDRNRGRLLPVHVRDKGAGDPKTFLYNTGTIDWIGSKNWNRPQFYTVTKVAQSVNPTSWVAGLACPPCNIGPIVHTQLCDAGTAGRSQNQ